MGRAARAFAVGRLAACREPIELEWTLHKITKPIYLMIEKCGAVLALVYNAESGVGLSSTYSVR